jgi:oligopeptide/dipeptide ABC transporter ATP-binding protein
MEVIEKSSSPLLEVRNLNVSFPNRQGMVQAVNNVSFTLGRGRILAILGESGSGKSVLLRTILGIQGGAAKISGEVRMRGTDLLNLSAKERSKISGSWVSMVFQNPMTALDPVFTVEQQIVETLRRHTTLSREEAKQKALELLRLVHIASPERRLKAYPFELSGGMRQRVVIAMALACSPGLLLADEPTTALDVTVQARVLDLLREIQQEMGTSIIFVTHDVAVAAEIADEVLVMYAGRIVETGPMEVIIREPKHPYTQGLLKANIEPGQKERPVAIPGLPPNLSRLPKGCAFSPRCSLAKESCTQIMPDLYSVNPDHYARCLLVESETVMKAAS